MQCPEVCMYHTSNEQCVQTILILKLQMTDAEIEFDVTVEDFWKIVAELEKVVEK